MKPNRCPNCGADNTRMNRILDVARRMRAAQKAYFRDRDYSVLDQSRALERELDNLIAPQATLPGMEG